MYQHRLTRVTAVALVAGAIAAPASSARVPDPERSVIAPAGQAQPAAMHASVAQATAGAQTKQDLRSPDARDAATPTRSTQDLRSPDAVDAAAGRGTFSAPDVVVVKLEEPQPQPAVDGLDWGDAGIGAGVLVALGLIALGGTLVVSQRRHTRAAFH